MLTALRALIAGQAREGTLEGIDSFRAALRRLFDRFELVQWPMFPKGAESGSVVYQGRMPTVERNGETLQLIPYVRPGAINWDSDEPEFPALKRVALAVRGNGTNAFPSLPFPGSILEPIALGVH